MVQVTYPGVYIQEVPSGVHTITNVGTSITAFIDFFREGPMNEPVEIFGMADFQRVFGGLDDRSEASYGIAQFFLNGGSSAYVVRVAGGSVDTADVILEADATGGGAEVLVLSAASAGLWGNNLRADIDYGTTDPTSTFNLTVTRYDGATGTAKPLAVETYLNLTMDSSKPRYAVKVINDASRLISAEAGAGAAASNRPAANGTLSGNLAALVTADFDAMSAQKISVKIGSAAAVDATLDTWAAGTVTTLKAFAPLLQKAIRAADTSASFTGATVQLVSTPSGAATPDLRLLVKSGRASKSYTPSEVVVIANGNGGADNAAQNLDLLAAAGGQNVQQYAFGLTTDAAAQKHDKTGADGDKPDATELIGDPALYTGLYALDRVDLFNLLCLPGAADLDATKMSAVYSAAIAFCDQKRAFVLVDAPATVTDMQKVEDWLGENDGLRNNNSALYFPRTQIPDPVNEFRLRSIGASGTLAGIYARTDSQRGVWKAPAGVEAVLNGVVQLDVKLTDAENGVLNPLAINCLRTFPVYGNVAWGARTLEGADQIASEWKYVPIRRLALMLEESLFRGTKWVVFEPNDEPLWAKIRLNVGAYMNSLFRQGAFQGSTPKDAYFVKCDGETTTEDDRNKGIVNILVGFAPLKPAEFVVISIQQIAGDL